MVLNCVDERSHKKMEVIWIGNRPYEISTLVNQRVLIKGVIWLQAGGFEGCSKSLNDKLVTQQPRLKILSDVTLHFHGHSVNNLFEHESLSCVARDQVMIWSLKPRTCHQYFSGREYVLFLRFTNMFEMFLLFWIRRHLPKKSITLNIYRFLF